MATLPQSSQASHWRQAPNWLHQVSTNPTPQSLATALSVLGLSQAGVFDAIQRLPHFHSVAATASAMLVAEGDKRSVLSPVTGLNRYGCAPYPQAGTVTLSSCTGNEPTKIGLSAVQAFKHRLMRAAWDNCLDEEQAAIDAQIKARIATFFGLKFLDCHTVTLTTSGSAATHLVAGSFCPTDQHCLYLLVGQKETGREVPDAISIGDHVTIEDVFIRHDETGQAVSVDVLLSRLEQRISKAIHQGIQVVLQVVEGSKTGLVAPGIDGVRKLMKRFPKNLHVVADFCQMRPGSQMQPYLDLGAAVVATGSKFLGGPAFSGLAIIPNGLSQPVPSVGTLARWEAALAECSGYGVLSAGQIEDGLKVFAEIVTHGCAQKSGISVVTDPELSHVMTLHVVNSHTQFLDMEQLRDVQGWLMADASALLPLDASAGDHSLMARRCLVGQPVMVGNKAGLRLAINAARLASIVDDRDGWLRLTSDVTILLGKLDLIRRFIG
jgi:hypothetical protein